MKELRELEAHLESWTPRRPSWRVKERAWAAGSVTASVEEPLGQLGYVPFRLGWLAPATMALLLSCVLFNQHSGSSFFGPGNSVLMVEAAMSNQGAATWLPGSFHREQNNAASFRWTTAAGWTSSISSLSGARGSD